MNRVYIHTPIKSYKDLNAWGVGIKLMKEIYAITKTFPDSERFGLTSQLQRASVSILANIAEGFGRFTFPDKAHKYTIARGECLEVDALLSIARELDYISETKAHIAFGYAEQERKILSGLISSCKLRS